MTRNCEITFMKLLLFPALLGFSLTSLIAAPEVIVSDDFSLNGNDRLEGLSLNGLPPQKGLGSWKVPMANNTILSANGTVTNVDMAPMSAVEGLIDIDEQTVPTIVQADVITKGAGWVAVGLLGSDAIPWFHEQNLLFVLLQPDGTWVLFKDGARLTQVATGKVAQYVPTEVTNLGLKYNPANGATFVMINNEVVSAEIDAGLSSTSKVTAAGFYIYLTETSEPGLASVDNFKVTIEKP